LGNVQKKEVLVQNSTRERKKTQGEKKRGARACNPKNGGAGAVPELKGRKEVTARAFLNHTAGQMIRRRTSERLHSRRFAKEKGRATTDTDGTKIDYGRTTQPHRSDPSESIHRDRAKEKIVKECLKQRICKEKEKTRFEKANYVLKSA